jgi:hypothetical protein
MILDGPFLFQTVVFSILAAVIGALAGYALYGRSETAPDR